MPIDFDKETLEKELKRDKEDRIKWLKEEARRIGKYAIRAEIKRVKNEFEERKRNLFEKKFDYFLNALESNNPKVKKPATEALNAYKRNYPDLYKEMIKKYKSST